MKKSSIICMTSGFILVAIGLSFLLALPMILLKIIHSKIILSPDNPSFVLWRDLPIPVYMRFHIFNVTNSQEILDSPGVVPHLQEIGPFTFTMDVKKIGLNFTDSQQKLSFRENIIYYFDRQLSVDDLSLKVTTINAPLATALALTNDLNPLMKTLAIILINRLKQHFFIERTVGELLFEGYPDILMKLAPFLNPKVPFQPSFGWMYDRNNTDNGVFVVETGKSDINSLNSIITWNGSPDLDYWSSSQCNSLSGAKDGELYSPILSTEQTLKFFRTDLCRVWTLVWQSSLKTVGDLQVYRYFPADTTFANSTDYPPNSCYETSKTYEKDFNNHKIDVKLLLNGVKNLLQNDSDLFDTLEESLLSLDLNETNNFTSDYNDSIYQEYPSGVFNMGQCHYGAPIFLSNPHFLKADPYYLRTINGLSPNSSVHQTYIDIEPITGTPIELQLRIQINVKINSMANNFKQYRNIPKIHFPVVWQEFSIQLTDEIVDNLHWTLTWPSIIATIISSLFVAIGAMTLLFVASKTVVRRVAQCWTSDISANNCDTRSLIDDNVDSDDSQPTLS